MDDGFVAAFARRSGIRRLALYGSVLREDFGPFSDVDILVEFFPGSTPGYLRLAELELELEAAVGREVELRTVGDLSRHFRDAASIGAREFYAA
jgi:predicted nucleotidyltransferase